MSPGIALLLLGVVIAAEWLYRAYRLVRPNSGPVFA